MNMIRLIGVLALSVLMSGCIEKDAEIASEPPAMEAAAPVAAEPTEAAAPVAAEPTEAAAPVAAEASAELPYVQSVPNPPPPREVRNGHATVNGHTPAEPAATVIGSNPVKNGVVHHKAARIPDVAGEVLLSKEPELLNEYAVKVQATEKMTLDLNKSVRSAGLLKVWIGQPGYEPSTMTGMTAANETLKTKTKADSAKIKPEFPDDPLAFDVDPKESKCQAVEPGGSEVAFSITPNKTGEFRVGASVELFKTGDCTGAAITKTAEPITVKVAVGVSKLPFYQEIWAAFMKFFNEFLAILAASVLFFFRGKLKKILPFMKDTEAK